MHTAYVTIFGESSLEEDIQEDDLEQNVEEIQNFADGKLK